MNVAEQKAYKMKHYAEAIRYMDNAKEALKKAGKDQNRYADKKYVRSACGTAYVGVLTALDAWLTLKGVDVPDPEKKGEKRKKQISFYYENVAKHDKKLLGYLDTVYYALHIAGYYDGIVAVPLIKSGFDNAYLIIDKIKPTA